MSEQSKKKKTKKRMALLASVSICLIAVLVPLLFLYKGLNQNQSAAKEALLSTEATSQQTDPAENKEETETEEKEESESFSSQKKEEGFDLARTFQNLFNFGGVSQEEKKETVEARLAEWNNFVQSVQSTPLPADMPQQELDSLKARAIDPEIEKFFAGIDTTEEISDEVYEKAKSYSSFSNDYSRLLERINQIPYDYIWRLEEDWDRYEFTMEYVNQDQYQNPPATLDADLSSVPLVIQWDLKWAYCPYGNLNIAFAGCAPTCLSMVLSYLKQDQTLTPVALAREAEENGLYVLGAGSSHDIFPVLAASHGVTCLPLGVDQAAIEAELAAGHPVILNMVPGIFTHVGHFIVATGIQDGKWVINDPNSIQRSNQLWDPATVLAECATSWSFSNQ